MPILDQEKIRMAAAAGRFYEGNALLLRRQMAETEARLQLPPPADCGIRGTILPHAGYVFSLATAMRTLAEARGGNWKRIVVLGPAHCVGFHGVAYAGFTRWRTPFGDLPTAVEALDTLLKSGDPLLTLREDAHKQEHSLEVQFPLIQYLLGTVPVLPLVVGHLSLEEARRLGGVFAALDTPETLWIVSSDFTHYGANFHYRPFGEPVREQLEKLDGEASALIAGRDLDGFAHFLGKSGATICGMNPIALYLGMLDVVDPDHDRITGVVVDRSDSGELTGDYSCVVDYVGISFLKQTN